MYATSGSARERTSQVRQSRKIAQNFKEIGISNCSSVENK